MKSRLHVLFALALLCCGMQVCAAIDQLITLPEIADAADLEVPASMQSGCDWRGTLMKTVMITNANRIRVTPEAADHAHGRVLEMQVTELIAPAGSRRELSVQGRIYQDGILMLAEKFYDTGKVSSSMTVCESILELATNVGGNIADWVQDSKMPPCDKGCTGIHPDEPIAIGREILAATPTAIGQDALACNWPSQMVKDFIADVDDMRSPLPSKLVVTDQNILNYPGRKLVLQSGRDSSAERERRQADEDDRRTRRRGCPRC